MASSSSSSSSRSTIITPRSTTIIKLQTPHPLRTPAAALHQLAEDCERLGIQEWDIYGDFDKPPAGATEDDSSSSFLRQFESELATEFGKEDAVFMPSGVMAQSIALLIHSKRNKNNHNHKKRFLCHATSHLLLHEGNGYDALCGLSAVSLPAAPTNDDNDDEPPAPADIVGLETPPLLYQHVVDADNDGLLEDVSTILLELPHRELGGKLTPWSDILKLQQLCQQQRMALHCDGARIFEATTGYQKSPAELAVPFDSVYVSFYKGLGGLSGAMLMGSQDFCDEARVWLRRFGGNLYTLLPYAVSGWSGYRNYWTQPQQQHQQPNEKSDDDDALFLSFQEKKDKLVRIAQELSSHAECSQVLRFEPPVPQVNIVHCYLRPFMEDCNRIRDDIQDRLGISIFHRLRPIETNHPDFAKGFRCKFELSMGQANGSVPDDVWIQAWTEFSEAVLPTIQSTES
jgi:threonine aldolase